MPFPFRSFNTERTPVLNCYDTDLFGSADLLECCKAGRASLRAVRCCGHPRAPGTNPLCFSAGGEGRDVGKRNLKKKLPKQSLSRCTQYLWLLRTGFSSVLLCHLISPLLTLVCYTLSSRSNFNRTPSLQSCTAATTDTRAPGRSTGQHTLPSGESVFVPLILASYSPEIPTEANTLFELR